MISAPKPFIQDADVLHEINAWSHNDWLCRPDLTGSGKLLMVRATIAPHHCHPFHIHPHREEIIHVAEGRAEQWVGDQYRILGPGEIAFVPAGVAHATYNPFDEPLVFHAILADAVLEKPMDEDEDPSDVSLLEPWRSMRKGMPACQILGDG